MKKNQILLMADASAGGGGKSTIYVKATEPLHEDGVSYAKGDLFEVDAKRAKALGKFVKEVNAKLDKESGKLVEVGE